MTFPTNFVREDNPNDFISPLINFIGNASIIVVGGIILSTVSYVALKILGFDILATVLATAIFVTIGAFVAVAALSGVIILAGLIYIAMKISKHSHNLL